MTAKTVSTTGWGAVVVMEIVLLADVVVKGEDEVVVELMVAANVVEVDVVVVAAALPPLSLRAVANSAITTATGSHRPRLACRNPEIKCVAAACIQVWLVPVALSLVTDPGHAHHVKHFRWVAVLLAVGSLAAACGTSNSMPAADVQSSTTASASTIDAPDTPAPLPASYRGVTADTITIGVVWSDLEELREMGLVDINYGDIPLVWQTVIDDINSSGGVGGRQLEMVFDQYNPVLSTSMEEMCLRLTQDHEVFAVVGSLAGPAIEGIPCFIESQETIVVGGTHRPELLERAKAPWITTEWSQDRRYAALLELYEREGLLDGRLGMLDDGREHTGLTVDIVLPTLADLGLTLDLEFTTTASGGDELALESQIALFAEKLHTEDIDTLLIVQSSIALGLPLVREAGFDGRIVTVDSGSFLAGIGGFDERSPDIYEGAYGPTLLSSDDVWAMDSAQECLKVFTSRNPEITVISSDQVIPGEPQWASVLLPACRLLQIFRTIAEGAGAELNPTTFEAAAYDLGSFELPGQPYNSISPGKLDANDGMGLGVFDPAVGMQGGLRELLPYISVTAASETD